MGLDTMLFSVVLNFSTFSLSPDFDCSCVVLFRVCFCFSYALKQKTWWGKLCRKKMHSGFKPGSKIVTFSTAFRVSASQTATSAINNLVLHSAPNVPHLFLFTEAEWLVLPWSDCFSRKFSTMLFSSSLASLWLWATWTTSCQSCLIFPLKKSSMAIYIVLSSSPL